MWGRTLVGRDRERAVLVGLLGRIVDGEDGVALVAGEPGIGKTRLVEDVAETANGMGLRVVWGRCREGEGAPPYWPWIQVVRGLGGWDPFGSAIDTASGPADRYRLFDAVSRQLDGRVAVITGGASGMGLATVERFLEEGASVVIGDINADAGRAAVDRLGEAGHAERVRFTVTDVSVEDDVAEMTALAVDAFGRLDIVFNNAGIGGAVGPITEIEVDDWDTSFAVLVRSVFLGTKHAAKVLIEQGTGGSIINTASVAAMGGGAGPQAYSAAKAAVVNLTKTTAVELAPHHIRVNAICPGFIFTPPMLRGGEEQAEEAVAKLQPWPERGEGLDIANIALFLGSDESSFITGQEHIVDGGLMAIGPRIWGNTPVSRNVHRIVGMDHGTTGRPATVRRL